MEQHTQQGEKRRATTPIGDQYNKNRSRKKTSSSSSTREGHPDNLSELPQGVMTPPPPQHDSYHHYLRYQDSRIPTPTYSMDLNLPPTPSSDVPMSMYPSVLPGIEVVGISTASYNSNSVGSGMFMGISPRPRPPPHIPYWQNITDVPPGFRENNYNIFLPLEKTFIGTEIVVKGTKKVFEGYPGVKNVDREIQKIDYSGIPEPHFRNFLHYLPDRDLEKIPFEELFKPLLRSYSSLEANIMMTELGKFHSSLELRDVINFDKKRFEGLELPFSIKQDIVNYLGPVLVDAPLFEITNTEFKGTPGKLNRLIIRGKYLHKISSAKIVYSEKYEEEIMLNIIHDDHLAIEGLCHIRHEAPKGQYPIVFESRKPKFRVEKRIFINSPDGSNMSTIRMTKLETYNFLANFIYHHRVHESLYSPDYTLHPPKDYREANKRDSNGATDLIHAVRHGRFEHARYLLDKGADPNLATFAFEYPIMFASELGNNEMIRLLLDYGAFINESNVDRENSLFYAQKAHKLKTVNFLIQEGADTSQLDITNRNYLGELVKLKPKILI